jgi:hypothetical protein
VSCRMDVKHWVLLPASHVLPPLPLPNSPPPPSPAPIPGCALPRPRALRGTSRVSRAWRGRRKNGWEPDDPSEQFESPGFLPATPTSSDTLSIALLPALGTWQVTPANSRWWKNLGVSPCGFLAISNTWRHTFCK